MNEKLQRDRGQIESAIVEAYDVWIRTGLPTVNQSFDHDGCHYEWSTDIIDQGGQPHEGPPACFSRLASLHPHNFNVATNSGR